MIILSIQANTTEAGSISGIVTDEKGNPLNRTWIKVGVPPNYAVKWTNESGYYMHDNLTLGDYTLLVRKRGYKIPDPIEFVITENLSDIHLDIKLKEIEDEEPGICFFVYFFTAVVLIIIFMILYMNIRKIKPEKPQKLEPSENLNEPFENHNFGDPPLT
jgi:hypothetical protein